MSYKEQICWDRKTKQFAIKRTYKDDTTENLPLSEWHLKKKVETFALVKREVETLELEQPLKVVFYKVPITYEILENVEDGTDWFLSEQTNFNPDDKFERRFLVIEMRNVNLNVTTPAPFPNALYKGEFPFLKITKGKSEKIAPEEIEELLTSGKCLGVFDINLQNKTVFMS